MAKKTRKEYIISVYSTNIGPKSYMLSSVDRMITNLSFLNVPYKVKGEWHFNSERRMEKLYKLKVSSNKLQQSKIKELRDRLRERGFDLKVFGELSLEEIV